jgi:Zn-dependent protease
VLWALAQPAAVAGLAAAFVLGLGVRAVAQRGCARLLGQVAGPVRPDPRVELDLIGAIAAVLSGTGWGRAAPPPGDRRTALAVLAGPVAVLAVSQAAFGAFRAAYPGDLLSLRLNRPSDVLHGVVAPTAAGELVLSVAVGLLCFGLLALVPLPPLDGYRLTRLLLTGPGVGPAGQGLGLGVAERLAMLGLLLLLVVPVGTRPPLLAALDVVGEPLVRVWA